MKYKRFLVDLKFNEYEELNNIIKSLKLTKADFLRKTIKLVKENLNYYIIEGVNND